MRRGQCIGCGEVQCNIIKTFKIYFIWFFVSFCKHGREVRTCSTNSGDREVRRIGSMFEPSANSCHCKNPRRIKLFGPLPADPPDRFFSNRFDLTRWLPQQINSRKTNPTRANPLSGTRTMNQVLKLMVMNIIILSRNEKAVLMLGNSFDANVELTTKGASNQYFVCDVARK